VIDGMLSKVETENIFYDAETGMVMVSDSETAMHPVHKSKCKILGLLKKMITKKYNVIKFLVDSAKGISTIKITKEVSPMTEATEAVLDTVVENVEVAPEAQSAEVIETPAVVEEAPAAELADAKVNRW
jgi:hypothetical protein